MNERVGVVKEIYRYPVKSILGESLSVATVNERGLIGDRLWAIKTLKGKIGSGKTTRRFQQIDGLFNYKARYEDETLIITMPDGLDYQVGDKTINEVLTESLGIPVTVEKEESISHFDEGPISIITTSGLRMLSEELGETVDPRRFRANILIDTDSIGVPEQEWVNRTIKVGNSVKLRVVSPLQRCVMVNNQQENLKQDARILRNLAKNHHAIFGVWAKVERNGEVKLGDEIGIHN